MALTAADVQKAYIAFFNRPADVGGLAYWTNYPGSASDLLDEFAKAPEYISDYEGLANSTMVNKVYNNLFGRDAEPGPTGLDYWVQQINAGYITLSNVAHEILNGAKNTDLDTVNNKVVAATAFTDALDTAAEKDAYDKAGANGVSKDAKDWLATVDASSTSVDTAKKGLDSVIKDLVDANVGGGSTPGGEDSLIVIGGHAPIVGTNGNNVFKAFAGEVNDTTTIDGGAGTDTLDLTLRADEAIAPSVRNVEKIVVRVQEAKEEVQQDNNIHDRATIDADRFIGVNRWESNNSRADLKVEDVRIGESQITRDVTVAFVESDPGHVDYALYFDPSSLRNVTNQTGNLVATIYDPINGGAVAPLFANVYDTILFSIDGKQHELKFGGESIPGWKGPDATYDTLAELIRAAIAKDTNLSGLGIVVEANHSSIPLYSTTGLYFGDASGFISLRLDGHTLSTGEWKASTGNQSGGVLWWYQTVDNPVSTDLVTSDIVLDYVGRGSRGGDLVIGSLSTGETSTSLGVEQFDITVKRDSQLEEIASTNGTLREVYIRNEGTSKYLGAHEQREPGDTTATARAGDLIAQGTSSVDTLINTLSGTKKTGPKESSSAPAGAYAADQDIDGADGEVPGFAFTDVRIIDAHGGNRGLNGHGTGDGWTTAFAGNLKLNAILTGEVVRKYLDTTDRASSLAAADNQVFLYDLGNNDDTFDLQISSENLAAAGTATREDLVLNIYGESGNDKISTVIYGGNVATATKAGANDGAAHWYQNAKINANLSIDAGAGNDTINTFGSGDWKITLGTGNDTLYVDNSGDGANSSQKAVWVFNTTGQRTATATSGEQALDDLQSDANDGYISVNDKYAGGAGYSTSELSGLHGLKLRVLFKDVSISSDKTDPNANSKGQGFFFSDAVAVPATDPGGFRITDLNINQAIKKAINDDPVLNKLLVAKDGPANTLVVTALSDGHHINVSDLQVEFAIPDTVGSLTNETAWEAEIGADSTWTPAQLQEARIASFNKLLGENATTAITAAQSGFNNFGPNPGSGYSNWYVPSSSVGGTPPKSDYTSAFANNGATFIDGTGGSNAVADNIIIVDGGSSDRDVVVLSTGANSNDTIKWNGAFNNGTTTVVNFDAGSDAATPASYTLTFGGSDGTGGSLTTIDLPGSPAISLTAITIGANLTDAQVAEVVRAGLAGQTSVTNDWDVTRSGVSVTLTQKVAAVVTGQGNPTVTQTGLLAAPTGTYSSYVPPSTLGDDWLDFTVYEARWLGAAQLDKDGLVTGNWTVSNDTHGAQTEITGNASGTLPTHVATGTANYYEDRTLHTGEKYITLTRAWKEGPDGAANPDQDTVYKIELWTLNGTVADAYTAAATDSTARDTAQLIGYVDLGRVIEGVVDVNSVIAQIDYIP